MRLMFPNGLFGLRRRAALIRSCFELPLPKSIGNSFGKHRQLPFDAYCRGH
jgi:hypothetical protein